MRIELVVDRAMIGRAAADLCSDPLALKLTEVLQRGPANEQVARQLVRLVVG